jgi:hypothetical protein
MKLFFVVIDKTYSLLTPLKVKRFLFSYFYCKDLYLKHYFRDIKPDELFIDSGGFEAQKNGAKINVKDYSQYIKRNLDMITVYANLDNSDINESQQNLEYMESVDLKPIPVWHATEPLDLFERMCEKYPYIAVGGVEYGGNRDITERVTRQIFPIAMKYKTKIHSFGMTFIPLLREYPFYSADSSSWRSGFRYGTVFDLDNRKNLISKKWNDDKLYLRRVFQKAKEAGLDVNESLFMKGDGLEISKWNAYVWGLIAEELENKNDAYWNDSRETNSEKLKNQNPGDRLPPETKGKIQEILKDPEVEAKRLAKLRESLTNFKTGKYAENLPYYCNNCYVKDKCSFYQEPKNPDDKVLCALREEFKRWFSPDDFDYREENTVNKVRNRIIDILLQRAAFNLWAELLDGGIQDKSLTNLLTAVLDRLDIKQPLIQQINKDSGDIVLVSADDIKKALEEMKKNGNNN